MAFDQATRNRLSKFVSDTRKLLSEEFAQQMRVKYGLDPATGVVTDIDKLPTMAEGDRQTAQMLRDTLQHYLATAPKLDKKTIATTIDRIVREQAFTVLNRLCAVRMAESRELVIESIAQGTKSKGFQLYARLAGSALGETGEAYVCYLFSLFDELSIDLPVLFDRFSQSARLFPRESVLIDVLGQINHHELQHLWAEDETIGWIYQYFNSQEERKAMRDASSAPRNSRELAVRNQFFTPRYVVEFLTDNTLGRIWYEMTQGQTRLVDNCKYLVRRPDEVFLSHMTSKDQKHPSGGTIAMAEMLLSGTEETFPEFKTDDRQPMIELAHCVSAYATMGDRAHNILGNRTLFVRERSVHEPTEIADAVEAAPYVFDGRLETIKTQHILEVLFMTCRNDRHGGDGSVYSESWFVDACNDVRRRVLNSRRDDLSQEEQLRQPVFIHYRPMKDPREIKMLDPACGSMHFGLYAFDLFFAIYEEAWELEESLGDRTFVRPRELKSLRDSYGTKERYMLDVPRLIIERNIHGIDIDARAVQIAGLSLWLRAQKAWHKAGARPVVRPQITRSNIVCAEPMPGESDLLEQFITEHLSETSEQQTIASIVRRVFDAMKLAGEAGSLLKIEEEIADTIAEAKKKWVEGPMALQLPLFAIDAMQKDSDARPLLVAGIDDTSFWDEIEERIYAALNAYGEKAVGEFQRKLFANDAAQGFAFIDLCRKKYDVIIMNPPFGDPTTASKLYLAEEYVGQPYEMYSNFIERFVEKTRFIGAISSHTFLTYGTFTDFRKEVLAPKTRVHLLADFGLGVMDAAMVRSAAYILECGQDQDATGVYIRLIDDLQKDQTLTTCLRNLRLCSRDPRIFVSNQAKFSMTEQNSYAYWATELLRYFNPELSIGEVAADVVLGVVTSGNEQFLRLTWEASSEDIKSRKWAYYFKGGDFQKYYRSPHLLIDWKHCGRNIAAGKSSAVRLRDIRQYFRPGLTFPLVNEFGINVSILPGNCIFDNGSPAVFGNDERVSLILLGLLNSRTAEFFVRCLTSTRHWQVGYVRQVPWPSPSAQDADFLIDEVCRAYTTQMKLDSDDETSLSFSRCPLASNVQGSLEDRAIDHLCTRDRLTQKFIESDYAIDLRCLDLYSFSLEQKALIKSIIGPHPCEVSSSRGTQQFPEQFPNDTLEENQEELRIHRVSLSNLESDLWSNGGTLAEVIKRRKANLSCFNDDVHDLFEELVSYFVGCLFGRWNILFPETNGGASVTQNLFTDLPCCCPGRLTRDDGVPVIDDSIDPEYPLRVPTSGVVVQNEGHSLDFYRLWCKAAEQTYGSHYADIERELCNAFGVQSIRIYLESPSHFFASHLNKYSKRPRAAPIYWPLSSRDGSMTVWVYYSQLTDQTLFSVVNEFIDPTIKDTTEELRVLRLKNERTREDEFQIDRLTSLAFELEEFRDEILGICRFWKPNFDDGVQILAAPLWKFFRHSKWRDTLKCVWDELEEGRYDWAHIALAIWPDRVVRSAHKDRSIAIAHNLEDNLWHEVEIKTVSRFGRVITKVVWQPRELSEKELDAIVAKVKSGELRTDKANAAEVVNG